MKKNDDFTTRLKIAKVKNKKNELKNSNVKSSNLGMGFKMSTEFVAAVAISTYIGFILDGWFGTKPLLILVFFFLGVVAGITNVIRQAKRMQRNNNG